MFNPFTTALQKIISYGAIGAFVVASGVAFVQWNRAKHAEKELHSCQEANATLKGNLELQNQAVESWRQNAEAAQELVDEALQRAAVAEKAAQGQIQARKAAIQAPPSGKNCVDALRTIREGLHP